MNISEDDFARRPETYFKTERQKEKGQNDVYERKEAVETDAVMHLMLRSLCQGSEHGLMLPLGHV